ncbi:RdgB/HAM1 family non-canonical purine NTP pyrophosphatase [Thermomicrobium sp. CFH 73360]|uniref:RdgB/HAM1 family non-canonical purine NTP pyrophosphatase n=1 Tax=Thermomicrobium sp. CFH 73360 TaxID=2951987 RepID=UPI0020770577|nr:RdgB/HAM1 family non-canonical purine NTP pyrophosphatase [Thermomicrobium sp. CFH 73360]MCM8746643.1 RdgB/HAM1 family non-canonical purine NTP pyrophosphatase [Thermomicrobium sp. CFH 73360]
MTIYRIVVATANPGKIRELRALLPSCFEAVTAGELGIKLPPETADTFAENALIKARAAAQSSGLVALADDSGLEVDALGGRPGVHSAHYAGEGATDRDNIQRLLKELRGVPLERRTARFRAVIALVAPDGREALAEGVVEGRIIEEPRGESGFGYDPIFQPLGSEHTFAEMSAEEKNQRSHRAQALQRALLVLQDWFSCSIEKSSRSDESRS